MNDSMPRACCLHVRGEWDAVLSALVAKTGSKPEPLFDARISAYAGCGHAVAFARGRFVPFPVVSRCSKKCHTMHASTYSMTSSARLISVDGSLHMCGRLRVGNCHVALGVAHMAKCLVKCGHDYATFLHFYKNSLTALASFNSSASRQSV
jgi:hypothetical protein